MKRPRTDLLNRMKLVQAQRGLRKFQVGDPVTARLPVNIAARKGDDPIVVAWPGDPGVVVEIHEPTPEVPLGVLMVQWPIGEPVDMLPGYLEPDWED
jgi:hypothetical protein